MAEEQINPLVKLIQERQPWLFSERGFRIVDYTCDRIGNCVVVLESERLRLTLDQSRGFTSMQLASGANTSKSYELGFLLLALTNHRPDFGFEGGAAVLKDNWTIVEEALGPNLVGTRQAYERREQESKAILERHQVRWRGRRNWLVYRMGGSSIGRVSLLLLRYAEIGLILWALYVVSHRGTT